MAKSRTENSFHNISTGMILRLGSLLLAFVSRSVFINILGDGCLGVNGLFTTILQMFSLAELGIGQAITFYMYKPIAEENKGRLIALIRFYKIAYRVIGLAIGIIGLVLIPFLPSIVNLDVPIDYNITAIYLLYLSNTVVSYLFFAYPRTVISAHQQEHITNNVDSVYVFASTVLEILSLLITGNFIVYLVVRLILLIAKNLTLGIIALRKYPYIREKPEEKLTKTDYKQMFKDVYALFIVKLSSQLFNSTDNLFISAMLGTVLTGYNSNYVLIINAVYGIISTIIYSCNASVGNLCAAGDRKKAEEVFRVMDFINFWISCFCTVCLYRLLNPFIALVWGEQYLFSMVAVGLMCFNFYMVSSLYALFAFRQGLGLFRHCIYNQFFAAVVNIILDYFLCLHFGLEGLLFATVFANLTLCIFPYARNLYKVGFEMSAGSYILRIIRGMLLCIACCAVTDLACMPLGNDPFGFVLQVVVCLIVPNTILVLLFFRTEPFKKALAYASTVAARFIKKTKGGE